MHRPRIVRGEPGQRGAHHPGLADDRAGRPRQHRARAEPQHRALEPLLDQIVVEGAIVLQIDFRPSAADLVERRLRNVEVTILDQIRHLAIEEGQKQGADVRAVNVGVGHQDDLVIAQLFEVEFLAPDARAEGLDHRSDFLRREHPVEARALDVEDLALQRENGLVFAVAALLGRAAGAVALDQEQLGLGRIALLAIVQLARQRSDAHCGLSPGWLAGLACSLARRGSIDDLHDDRAGVGRVFLEPLGELVGHQAFKRLANLGAHQLVLGLRAELGIGQLDRNDRGQPLAHVLTGQ